MSALESFRGVKQVRVCAPLSVLRGYMGRIVRRRKQDDGAWVRMDRDLPEALRAFPPTDERFRDVLLYPKECETVPKPEPAQA
jgi:hypothetical protein